MGADSLDQGGDGVDGHEPPEAGVGA
jgi:hypothetical protein